MAVEYTGETDGKFLKEIKKCPQCNNDFTKENPMFGIMYYEEKSGTTVDHTYLGHKDCLVKICKELGKEAVFANQ